MTMLSHRTDIKNAQAATRAAGIGGRRYQVASDAQGLQVGGPQQGERQVIYRCTKCQDKGWLIWVYPERKPRPAYWFTRIKGADEPTQCGCQTEAWEAL